MGLSNMIISMLIICAVTIGFVGFYGMLAQQPEYGLTEQNFSSFYAVQNITTKIETMSQTFQNSSSSEPIGGLYVLTAPIQYIIGATQAGLLVFDMPNLFHSMITDVTGAIGIPQIYIDIAYAIILVTFVFAIIYFIISKR